MFSTLVSAAEVSSETVAATEAASETSGVSAEIMSQIDLQPVFDIHVPFIDYKIPVFESTIVTWIIMAVIVLLAIILTRKLKIVPTSKVQIVLETCVGWIRNFCRDNIGPEGDRYMCYIGTVLIYIGAANIIGMFGMKPPTKDINVTIALAAMSIILIEGATFRKHGFLGFFKKLGSPTPIMAPMNILEIGIRPLSLCLRLFGNVVAAFIIMELIKYVIPVGVPTIFSLYFDIFDGFLQAYIFVFLTSLFIGEGLEDPE